MLISMARRAKVIAETLVTGVRPIADGYEVITTSIKDYFRDLPGQYHPH